MKVMAFVGRSGSGKTDLIEKLIVKYKQQGLKVGSIKHHSHTGFDYDVPGKDSARFFEAGSMISLVASPDKLALQSLLAGDIAPEQLIEIVKILQPKLDILLIEGYKQSTLPTIELFRAANSADAKRHFEFRDTIKAVVTDIEQVASNAQASNVLTYGFDMIDDIAYFIANLVDDII